MYLVEIAVIRIKLVVTDDDTVRDKFVALEGARHADEVTPLDIGIVYTCWGEVGFRIVMVW